MIAALKCTVAQPISNFYQVVAIRALIKQGENSPEIWRVRQLLEGKLKSENKVVGFFSCPTALQQVVGGKKIEVPGMAFWVMFDWPEYGLTAFESHLTKLCLSCGISNLECKAVKARSK